MRRSWVGLLSMALLATACMQSAPATPAERAPATTVSPPTHPPTNASKTLDTARSTTSTTAPPTTTTTTALSPYARPSWLGTRVLPLRGDGFGEVLPTPEELIDRQLLTLDLLPRPVTDKYVSTIESIPSDVLNRSTWRIGCPVGLENLRYLTFSHHGFDGQLHTGELIVHATVAEDIAWVFGELFAARFPIEQFMVTTMEQLESPPTGDGNRSGAFGCRPVAGRDTGWSQHAYGLAIDINPFHNPYRKGDLVIPELASFYLDRTLELPGMIGPDSVVVETFAAIGWKWGGNWTSLDDWMHFSQNGH